MKQSFTKELFGIKTEGRRTFSFMLWVSFLNNLRNVRLRLSIHTKKKTGDKLGDKTTNKMMMMTTKKLRH